MQGDIIDYSIHDRTYNNQEFSNCKLDFCGWINNSKLTNCVVNRMVIDGCELIGCTISSNGTMVYNSKLINCEFDTNVILINSVANDCKIVNRITYQVNSSKLINCKKITKLITPIGKKESEWTSEWK